MAEPAAQFGRWGEVFGPFVEGGVCTGDSAGPEPVDEDSTPVIWAGRVVDPLGLKIDDGGPALPWMTDGLTRRLLRRRR
jgi:hypothetical protein